MSCPENELIKFPFHKSAHNPWAHFKWSHSVTSWIINSWDIAILFYHKRIGTRQQHFCRKMLLGLRQNIYHHHQWHQASNICLLSIQKLIQHTFTHVTLWWFSDTCITSYQVIVTSQWHKFKSKSKFKMINLLQQTTEISLNWYGSWDSLQICHKNALLF